MENENKEMESPQGIECFDESEFFDKELYPKMQEIFNLCKERRIPLLIHAIRRIDEGGHSICQLSTVQDRNGGGVADLICCAKILSGKPHPLKSLGLRVLSEQ